MSQVVDRRFVADAAAHRRDAPRFCPSCACALALATEFWEAEDRRFYCWCGGCGWTGEITGTGDVAVGHEGSSLCVLRRARTRRSTHDRLRASATTSRTRSVIPRSSVR